MVNWLGPLLAFMVLSCLLVFAERLTEWSWDLKRHLDKLEAHRPWISIVGCAYGIIIVIGCLVYIGTGIEDAALLWFTALVCGLAQAAMGAILSHEYLAEKKRLESKGSVFYMRGVAQEGEGESDADPGGIFAELAKHRAKVGLVVLALSPLLLLAMLFLDWPG